MNNSLKEKVRYWFEFLKLAHKANDPVVRDNLRASRQFYAAWGDYEKSSFTSWWKEHSTLFRSSTVLSVPKVGDVVEDDSFYIRIPYTYAQSTVGRIVSEMYGRELNKRSVRTKKMRKVYGGSFLLDPEDYQVAQFHYYLVFVRDVYLHLQKTEPGAKTGRLIERSKEVFGKLSRKTTLTRDIPFTNPDLSYESASRMVRRYRQYSEKLLRNVSKGVFPGDYEETFIKNQSQLRAEKAAKKKTEIEPKKRLRGTRRLTSGVRTANLDDPYLGSKRKTRKDKGVRRGKYRI